MKKIIKKIFNFLGMDVVRLNKSPKYLLLGLRNLQINTIIDVGANTGQFAEMIEKVFPKANIYSFEPVFEAFEKLNKLSIEKNGRIKAINLALGDSSGEIEMFHHTKHTPSSSILKTTDLCEELYPFTHNQQNVKVKIATLDNAINELNISLTPEILIKLDVQGYENRVIKGGQKIFKIAKACILEVGLD